MNSTETSQRESNSSDSEVIDTMIKYMREFLEQPHPVFGGLPICPFARKARLDGDILYKVDRFQLNTDLNLESPTMRMIAEFCQQELLRV